MKQQDTHIIPKHYLKGFTNNHGCIFTYPNPDNHSDQQCKGHGGGRGVRRTAYSPGFYSEQTETSISAIESNGSRILRKILNEDQISASERDTFAQYMLTFLYRVPYSKERATAIFEDEFTLWVKEPDYFIHFKDRNNLENLTEVDYLAVLLKMKSDDALARDFWETSITARREKLLNVLLNRNWWVLKTQINGSFFVASDNPLYYSISRGMKVENIQVTFPLSQNMVLIFNGSPDPKTDIRFCKIHMPEDILLVDEINQRTTVNSKEIYSPKKELMIAGLLGRTEHHPKTILCPTWF